jgi:hypothetical protein
MSIYEDDKFIKTGFLGDTYIALPDLYKNLLLNEFRPDHMKFYGTNFNACNLSLIPNRKEIEENINYKINEQSYRSSTITGKEEFIFSGCSQTFGMGIHEQDIWGEIIAKENNVSHLNFGQSGAGMRTIVKNLFGYFKVYGHPKYLRILAPDFLRFQFVKSPEADSIKTKILPSTTNEFLNFIDTFAVPDRDNTEKYFKSPINIQDIMPFSYIIQENIDYINMLESYISQTDIDFKWSTWSPELRLFFNINKDLFDFKYYIEPNFMFGRYDKSLKKTQAVDVKSGLPLTCHVNRSGDYMFDVAADEYYHMGVHEHMHFAELLGINDE